ncbi:MAG: hypothetical protein CMJ58_00090 [Planctomycetaceae bacterium]|nr:hypothetical protein [Planctomycetaceae bacterium]
MGIQNRPVSLICNQRNNDRVTSPRISTGSIRVLLRALRFARLLAGAAAIAAIVLGVPGGHAATYHVDSAGGDDDATGTDDGAPWKTLQRASMQRYAAGDRVLLKSGAAFAGKLVIRAEGAEGDPVIVEPYGEGDRPLINAQGYRAGVAILDSAFVIVRGLEITADGGTVRDGTNGRERFGVLVEDARQAVTVQDVFIHDVYPSQASQHEGKNPTTHLGFGIAVRGGTGFASSHIVISNCRIERTGFKGIDLQRLVDVRILDNQLKDIGGPGLQSGRCQRVVLRGNVVINSGSDLDPRMHGRGSGYWPWTCSDVLVEQNQFIGARGPADSCGVHIDFNCSDVIVQRNLSRDNAGGFVEILGNCRNCAYRYNISVNDGRREAGADAHQYGKVLWTSGFVGSKRPRTGPFNCYIYNNTIFADESAPSYYSFSPTTAGLLVANNVFCIKGDAFALTVKEERLRRKAAPIPRAVVRNNLYLRQPGLPPWLPVEDVGAAFGDPEFANAGGAIAGDYWPRNRELIRDRGIAIKPLTGDDVGLRRGLEAKVDFFGHPIEGRPDLGAIEIADREGVAPATQNARWRDQAGDGVR